jgi:hypothetical protein
MSDFNKAWDKKSNLAVLTADEHMCERRTVIKSLVSVAAGVVLSGDRGIGRALALVYRPLASSDCLGPRASRPLSLNAGWSELTDATAS